MSAVVRKKSPRAPSLALEDAIERALRVYEKERRHPAPLEAVAQHLGYKSATNGSAVSVFATLRYYGLVERPKDGMLAVSKDVESYLFAPSDQMKQEFVVKWLKSPPIFAELLEKYHDGLPSDANIRYELIQRGFLPDPAEACLSVFRKSVEYARYFDRNDGGEPCEEVFDEEVESDELIGVAKASSQDSTTGVESRSSGQKHVPVEVDRIPVRLAGGRRAWIEIPTPFYLSDKRRIKAQIDLLLTDDEDEGELFD